MISSSAVVSPLYPHIPIIIMWNGRNDGDGGLKAATVLESYEVGITYTEMVDSCRGCSWYHGNFEIWLVIS